MGGSEDSARSGVGETVGRGVGIEMEVGVSTRVGVGVGIKVGTAMEVGVDIRVVVGSGQEQAPSTSTVANATMTGQPTVTGMH